MQLSEAVPTNWQAVALGFVPVLSVLIIQYFQYLQARLTAQHLVKVEKKVDDTKLVADATHTLTNSATGANLELLVSAYTQLLAKGPEDKSVQSQLATAKKNLETHKINQAVVDARLNKFLGG